MRQCAEISALVLVAGGVHKCAGTGRISIIRGAEGDATAQLDSAEQERLILDLGRLGAAVVSVASADNRVVFGAPRQFDASRGSELRAGPRYISPVAGFGDPLQLLIVGRCETVSIWQISLSSYSIFFSGHRSRGPPDWSPRALHE